MIRDPHDSCVSVYNQALADDSVGCKQWDDWCWTYAEGKAMPWGGWLHQNKQWWDAHQRHPEQVLWVTFEECKADPRSAVRRVAAFLGMEGVSDEVLAKTVDAIEFATMKRHLERHGTLRDGGGKASTVDGKQLSEFSKKQRQRFHQTLVVPAHEYGVPFQSAAPEYQNLQPVDSDWARPKSSEPRQNRVAQGGLLRLLPETSPPRKRRASAPPQLQV